MCLLKASAEFTGTALEVLRFETLRVCEAALRIIVDGLGMKMADVLSGAGRRRTAADSPV